ncbi:flagellar basal body rod protein FlgC [Paremcibacter congregatus]|tara:strand:+ start:2621 stop:3019 length:399 start_codon:yes stop_codon:yes gene_type:complete
MFKAIQTSVSGLLASTARANTAASNIVNSQVTSTPFSPNTGTAQSPGFTPQRLQQTTTAYGGVRTTNVPVSPASLSVYNPSSPLSNEQGLVDVPNVSFPAEIAELQRAKHAYAANAKMIKALDETAQVLLKS